MLKPCWRLTYGRAYDTSNQATINDGSGSKAQQLVADGSERIRAKQ